VCVCVCVCVCVSVSVHSLTHFPLYTLRTHAYRYPQVNRYPARDHIVPDRPSGWGGGIPVNALHKVDTSGWSPTYVTQLICYFACRRIFIGDDGHTHSLIWVCSLSITAARHVPHCGTTHAHPLVMTSVVVSDGSDLHTPLRHNSHAPSCAIVHAVRYDYDAPEYFATALQQEQLERDFAPINNTVGNLSFGQPDVVHGYNSRLSAPCPFWITEVNLMPWCPGPSCGSDQLPPPIDVHTAEGLARILHLKSKVASRLWTFFPHRNAERLYIFAADGTDDSAFGIISGAFTEYANNCSSKKGPCDYPEDDSTWTSPTLSTLAEMHKVRMYTVYCLQHCAGVKRAGLPLALNFLPTCLQHLVGNTVAA
jgi:hypothetical protein